MSINIPDKIYKLLILVGIICVAYGMYSIEKHERYYFDKIDQLDGLNDSISITELRIENKIKNIENIADNLSKTYEEKNPITSTDSTILFNRVLKGNEKALIISDSLQKLWTDYINSKFELKLLKKKQSLTDKHLESEKKIKESYVDIYGELWDVGFVLFSIGILLWTFDSNEKSFSKNIIKQNEKVYSHCQSCGKDFSSMRKYGTNKDKSTNFAFCIKCYRKGHFENSKLTKDEFSKEFLAEFEQKSWLTKAFVKRRLGGLERWKK